MQNHYDIAPGEVFWAASDVGWVFGHSYICQAPLLHGCTQVVYEGKPVGTLDAGAFWRVISDHGIAALIANYDLSHFRTLFLAGERSEAAAIKEIGDGVSYRVPAAIDDVEVLDEIVQVLKNLRTR